MTAGWTNSESLSQHWCTPAKYLEFSKYDAVGDIRNLQD